MPFATCCSHGPDDRYVPLSSPEVVLDQFFGYRMAASPTDGRILVAHPVDAANTMTADRSLGVIFSFSRYIERLLSVGQ